jgi:NAD(P)-dependent dehydrogenase (short-subunit alcohol dehydrogenase family)
MENHIMKRIALITGVSSGIGRAAAYLFSEKGWHVVGIDQKNVRAIEDLDHFITVDLSEPEAPEQIFRELTDRERCVDALINNAAVQICKPLHEMTLAEWDLVMATNVRSVFLLAKAFHPLLKGRGTAIVNVSSVHAIATSANIAAYAASKGALAALTRAMALEFAGDDIRVNAVLPGAVDTPMLHAGLLRYSTEEEPLIYRLKSLGRKHPIGRIGRPEEIAKAILFLSDHDQSAFITGQSLIVDGGATARLSTE